MISSVGKIAANSLFLLISRLVELSAGILVVVLVARYLGINQFGDFSFVRAITFMYAPIITFGSLRIIVREISVDASSTNRFLTACLLLNVLMAAAGLILVCFIPLFYHSASEVVMWSIYISLFSQTFLCMQTTTASVFIAHEKTYFNSVINIVNRSLIILLVFLATRVDAGMIFIFIALLVANVFGFLFSVVLLRRTGMFALERTNLSGNLFYLIKESYPIAIVGFMVQGYSYYSVFLLRILHGTIQVSLFEVSQKTIVPIALIGTSMMLAFVPTLSRLGRDRENYEKLLGVYQQTLKLFIIITVPFCFLATYHAHDIIAMVFGDEFIGAVNSFQIIIWTIIPAFCNGLLNFVLTSIQKQRSLLISNSICFSVFICLSFFFIGGYGYLGASWLTVITYVLLFSINFYFVYREIGSVPFLRLLMVPLSVGLAFFLVFQFLFVPVNGVATVFIFVSGYVLALYSLGYFTVEEKLFFQKNLAHVVRDLRKTGGRKPPRRHR